MKLAPIALFRGTLTDIPDGCSARRRNGKRGRSTQVSCMIEERNHRFYAVPQFTPAENTVTPTFRMQLRMTRRVWDKYGQIGVVLQPTGETRIKDPEQRILRPMYSDEVRLLFEFERAEVLSVDTEGVAALRFAAIDPVSGQIGTRERPVSDIYAQLIQRCTVELAGGERLFPAVRRSGPIPDGAPVLEFARQVESDVDVPIIGLG
jgi:hypothetical protein